MASETQNSPFIKSLTSSDKEIRDQALDSLRTYLSSRTEISELDLMKLWKGLFYCLWMQDKPVHQQRLSKDLASLVPTLQPAITIPFLAAFWKTMAREWGQIEALRMDKYLFLIRQYVNASFKFLAQNDWADKARIESYMAVLEETPLSPNDVKIPNGMRYHALDIYVDELEKVGGGDWEKKKETLEILLGPIKKLQKEGRDKTVRKAAQETLDDERLPIWRGEKVQDTEMEEGEGGTDDEWGGIED
ncbi:nucleolar protein-like protein NOP52 variant [Pleomassaria siparia CBS 279.74]|uniref:Nucleolar protein-like protein NOP52 variant n=1 Tax=Pleomassaria siparia CBS 279.74 TaxID=1314801 RepID=A0A6G1K2S4_9PLEO|nr:nucleolar protein-like protein NOP52 variant [Pleomassaria siparia CBS 279.74]